MIWQNKLNSRDPKLSPKDKWNLLTQSPEFAQAVYAVDAKVHWTY